MKRGRKKSPTRARLSACYLSYVRRETEVQKEGGNIHTEKNRRKKTPLSLFSARVPGGGVWGFQMWRGVGEEEEMRFLSLSLSLFSLSRECVTIYVGRVASSLCRRWQVCHTYSRLLIIILFAMMVSYSNVPRLFFGEASFGLFCSKYSLGLFYNSKWFF